MKEENTKSVTPERILQVGMGFWASKTLLTAIKLELFTHLGDQKLSSQEIKQKLGLHGRGFYDFMDALVALGFLERDGIESSATYGNTTETSLFLDKNKESYIGGILEMANNRLYRFWGFLEEALITGEAQSEVTRGEKPFFEELYADEERLNEFVSAMAGIQMGNFVSFAKKFDFSHYKTLCDIGGAGGFLCAQVAMLNPHMQCMSFDMPVVCKIAEKNIKHMHLNEQVKIIEGDFFKDSFPKADIITMGNILHDWGLKDKKLLINKAYEALPEGGAFIVIENIIDNDRRHNAFGMMMSLNMLIETPEGFDYSFNRLKEWTEEAGFKQISSIPLTGATSAAIAIK
ncbi:methyltransferase [Limibacter armeniacum]|uniref:methyltransferase n=1 Tax=Limibacter armeniacum TaxID=466084 RepID=UPI002FE66D7A